MEKIILCQHCGQRINSGDDLVTAFVLFSAVPYHRKCYAQALKGFQTIILGNQPINSVMGTLGAVLAGLIALLLRIPPWEGNVRFFTLVAVVVMPIARLYSYLAYERTLDRGQ